MNPATPDITRLFEALFGASLLPLGLEHLAQVVGRFAAIPYENLTKIIKAGDEADPVRRMRQPVEVLSDYARWGSGGTCFSLTSCLQSILMEYGYSCRPHMADLGNHRNNHCALIVDYNGRLYLLDPGYLITRPLPVPAGGSVVHETALHPVLLERDRFGDGLNLSTLEPDGSKFRYRLDATPCDPKEFIRHWIDSFSWNMMHSLLITRVIPDGRFYLHDRHVRWFNRDGRRTGKLTTDFDDQVSSHTGIHRDIVLRARSILAETKRELEDRR